MGSGNDEAQHHKSATSLSPIVKLISEQTALGQACVSKGDYHGALEHFQSALEKAETLSDKEQPKLKFSCLLNLGACLVSSGNSIRGLNMLETALALLETGSKQDIDGKEERKNEDSQEEKHNVEEEIKMRADLHYNIGAAAQALGEHERAVEAFKLSVAEHMKIGDKKQAAEVFRALAGCHQQSRQYDSQIACLLSAQRLLGEVGEEEREALVCADLSMVYYTAGRDEECRQMLTTAKMMSLRLSDTRAQGQLHSRIGLIQSSLGMYSEAVQSFERALPLVRMSATTAEVGETAALKMEASILQNIGAVHNERGNYSDAVIYNMAAARLNGRVDNIEAEAKCFCNLAFAQTQLKNFPSAAEHYSCCLLKAQAAGNLLLQFQAHEGLGSVGYSTQQYSRAVSCFKQALVILEKIGEETGMDRERVMEKLSDATLAMKKEAERRTSGRSSRHSRGKERVPVKKHVKLRKAHSDHSRSGGDSSVDHPDEGDESRTRIAAPTEDMLLSNSRGLALDSSYDRQVQAYMETYLHSNSSSTLASLTSSSSASSDPHLLGASIFSRNKNQLPSPLPVNPDKPSCSHIPEIPEGSLALGLDTRQQYTTVEVEEQDTGKGKGRGKKGKTKKKGRKSRKIVPLDHATTASGPPQEQQLLTAHPPPRSRGGQTRSSLCTVL